MSRSGYNDDCDDNWQHIRWRGVVASATRGKRGQAFFRDLLNALDAMPVKCLIAGDLVREDGPSSENFCAIGALGKARGVDMTPLDPEDSETVAAAFDIAEPLACEVVFENDEAGPSNETPEQRWLRMRRWVAAQIKPDSEIRPPA